MGETSADLERRLGHHFRDRVRLTEALTHSTFANENAEAGSCNERLEFLGDAVVDALAAELVFERFASAPEGELTRRRARVVCQDALADMAEELGLAIHLRLGRGQDGPSRSMLADAFEALVGAVFVDAGYEVVKRSFGVMVGAAIDRSTQPLDFKTRLQELCHRRGLLAPQYRVIAIDGPDHARVYTCEIVINSDPWGSGSGSSKKIAEQECARIALTALESK